MIAARRPRVYAAQLSHETNVFSSVPTDLAAFDAAGVARGDEIADRERDTNTAFGGFLRGADAQGFDLWPILSVWATPSGMVTEAAFEALLGEVVRAIHDASVDMGIDGVLLALHGAMVAEHARDADGEILARVRAVIGPDVPIVATLDLHANISPRMIEAADVLIGYDTYPHVDMADRAEEACAVLARLIRGEIEAKAALVKPPMLPTSQRMTTDRDPMRRLLARAHTIERDPRVVNVTVAGGFPPADVPEAGLSIVVTVDGDAGLALAYARELGRLAWDLRNGFLGGVTTWREAARLLSELDGKPAEPTKPLVIVDIGDNPWTGGPGDSVELVRFLLERRVAGAAVALVADAESARAAHLSRAGDVVQLTLGGKTDGLHGEPLPCEARVVRCSDGCYVNEGPMMAGLPVNLGPSALLAIGDPELLVLVTSRAETPIDLNIFRAHGVEPTALRVIGLKGKGHFRAAFEPIASQVVLVEGPGITGADLSRLPFQHIRRPIWPLDDLDWNGDAP